jgi:hypothetical protein
MPKLKIQFPFIGVLFRQEITSLVDGEGTNEALMGYGFAM